MSDIKLFTEEKNVNLVFQFHQNRLPSLDGLRAFSIILVITSHIAYDFPDSQLLKLDLGSFGVSVFFVISGFLITTLLLQEKNKTGTISLKNFYIRRCLRILPVAYLFILVLMIIDSVFHLNIPTINFFRAFSLSENFVDHSAYGPTNHYWSLSVEEQFYLLFPFILTKGIRPFAAIAIFLFAFVPVLNYVYYHYAFSSAFIKYPLFILNGMLTHGMLSILTGCMTAILFFKFPDKFFFSFKYITLIQILLLLTAMFLNIFYLPAGINNTFSSICIGLLLLSVVNNSSNIIFKILNAKAVIYIGVLSYSLYIWQQIFTFQQPWAASSLPGKSITLNLLLLLIIAIISYHGYEKQFLKLKHRFHKYKPGKANLNIASGKSAFENAILREGLN